MTNEADILDLEPRLRRRRSSRCGHLNCEVDMAAAALTCLDCGAEIDPWWYLRRLAADHEAAERRQQKREAELAAWQARANETIARLSDQIAELTETKNRLWNESVNGVPLGTLVRRRRRRARARAAS